MTPAGPCGSWGLAVYDATSGASLIRTGYRPGP